MAEQDQLSASGNVGRETCTATGRTVLASNEEPLRLSAFYAQKASPPLAQNRIA